jgi:putative PIN family toxin of toxin-antitoxin system
MIRVVLDTNVLVSAILTPAGPPARILQLALEGRLRITLSAGIIKEINLVFQYSKLKKVMKKQRLSYRIVEEVILKILKVASITPGTMLIQEVSRDPADNLILSCAAEGQADFIISGDKDLTELVSYEGISIVDPASFLQLIEAKE